jgi:benzoyl-CoA-dihydrodiol lyase
VLRTVGSAERVLAYDSVLAGLGAGRADQAGSEKTDWLANEIVLYLKRTLKRLDVTSRSLIALIEPGSCFAGSLAELAFAADRSFIHIGTRAGDNRPEATLALSPLNFGAYPMGNGLTRLATRFLGETQSLEAAERAIGETLSAADAEALGLVTAAYDEVDWDEEIRLMLEERASFSPDALTGLEANLRFAGPETMETRIFGRLTAWQNWIFQRPNAAGDQGALKLYGTGTRPKFNPERT